MFDFLSSFFIDVTTFFNVILDVTVFLVKPITIWDSMMDNINPIADVLSSCISWLPPQCLVIFGVFVSLAIVFRILGRS